jgi:nitrile hydratase
VASEVPAYRVGDRVDVLPRSSPGHVRTPRYVQTHQGRVTAIHGRFPDPESLAHRGDGTPVRWLYEVTFHATALWGPTRGTAGDARQTPATGASIVARAWVDEPFKQRLLADADAALTELGVSSAGPVGFKLVAVENTPDVRHLVVCTLCSCYPRTILGRPPDWYKSAAYRSRAVVEPRAVLDEFGTHVGADVEVVVHDSTADVRYLVVPERPAGTDDLDEEALADLVGRDCLIGVADPRTPDAASLRP